MSHAINGGRKESVPTCNIGDKNGVTIKVLKQRAEKHEHGHEHELPFGMHHQTRVL